MTPLERKIVFLKSHAGREHQLAKVLRTYFSKQANRMASSVLQADHPGTWLVPEIFNLQSEHKRLLKVVRRPLLIMSARAAQETLYIAKHNDDRKAMDDFFHRGWEIGFDLPELVLQSIRAAITDLTSQPYWIDLQQQTVGYLQDIIELGVEEGANAARIARQIREELGGSIARYRALRIARTETTGALNAGHEAAGDDLQRDGFTVMKQWSTTMDSDARPDHVSLNGSRVRQGEEFNVGGTRAPYPGHYSLPAAQRVNCRCACFTRVVE